MKNSFWLLNSLQEEYEELLLALELTARGIRRTPSGSCTHCKRNMKNFF
jgi:hypothetical protein